MCTAFLEPTAVKRLEVGDVSRIEGATRLGRIGELFLVRHAASARTLGGYHI
jgi:hypothetical protein